MIDFKTFKNACKTIELRDGAFIQSEENVAYVLLKIERFCSDAYIVDLSCGQFY